MKTNYQMIRELTEAFTPQTRGIVTMSEIYLINEKLCLDEMDVLQLQNLRDFTVMYFDRISETADDPIEAFDKMSAIASVIDDKIVQKGGEV